MAAAADRTQTRRRLAAVLAGAAGLLHLVEPGLSGAVAGPLDLDPPALVVVTSALLVTTLVLVPAVGGWLALRRPDTGLAVLAIAAAASLPAAIWMLRDAFVGFVLVAHMVAVAAAVLLLTAVLLLLGARDPDRWRWDRTVPASFVALAAVAVVFSQPALGLPLRDLLRPQALGDVVLLLSLAGPAVLAAAAVAAARLPRHLGGAMLLAAFLPTLAAALMHASSALVVVDGQRAAPFGPLDWLGVAGQVAVIGVATRWAASSDTEGVPVSVTDRRGTDGT